METQLVRTGNAPWWLLIPCCSTRSDRSPVESLGAHAHTHTQTRVSFPSLFYPLHPLVFLAAYYFSFLFILPPHCSSSHLLPSPLIIYEGETQAKAGGSIFQNQQQQQQQQLAAPTK